MFRVAVNQCALAIGKLVPRMHSLRRKLKFARLLVKLATAKRILERLHHRLSKFDRSVFLILKPISYFFGFHMAWFFIYKLLEFVRS